MTGVNRRQLRYFLAVVEHGSLGHAAAALGVAQPSLSQALGVLEKELGAELLHRVSRGAVLTPAGRAFVRHARRLLREMGAARDALARMDGHVAGVLDLVTTPVLAVAPCAALLGRFRRLHPQAQVQVRVAERDDDVCGMLADGRAEVGLGPLPQPADQAIVHEWGAQEILAVFPPDTDPAALPEPLPMAALSGQDVVGVSGTSRQKELVDRAFAAAGVRGRVVLETAHREAVTPFVLAGAGMSFLAGAVARWAGAQGAVIRRLDPPLHQPYGLVHGPGRLSPVGEALVELALRSPPTEAEGGPADPGDLAAGAGGGR